MTAVLVAHDGARWLPATLDAVKGQWRPVQRFVAVDTGSRDDTRALLEAAVGASSVIDAPRRSGFGAAVHRAVRAFAGAPGLASTRVEDGSPVEWLWLLHDDSAPAPDALERLLEVADEMPSAAVIGPKLRGWHDRQVLLEVGHTVDGGGRRETGLEPGELDHGQHDGDHDVLAVNTAGMLVRRDVWDELGGLDTALPLFRDDLDFGWRANLAGHRVVACSRAVVYHAQAAAAGVRRIACTPPGVTRPVGARRLDRRAALRTMLANCAPAALPFTGTRLLVACALRSIAFLLLKRPSDAWDEVCAAAPVFARPRVLARARTWRRAHRVVASRHLRTLFAPPGTRLRHYSDAFGRRMAEVGRGDLLDERGFLRRLLMRPPVVLAVLLTAVSLVAERHVLGGTLYGGALLPASLSAGDLWHTYAQSWHPTAFGSSAVAPPYLAILAAVAVVFFGSVSVAVEVLVLGSVPLAGLAAYRAARRLPVTRRARFWMAAAYALLPVSTGAIGTGRLGVAVVVVLLPLLLTAMAAVLLPVPARPAPRGRRAERAARVPRPSRGDAHAAWAASLLFAVAAAFDPLCYVLLAPLAVVAAVPAAVRRSFLGVWRALILVAVPPLLLLPWAVSVWHHPGLLATGVGQPLPGLQASRLAPADVLLLHPGGPGLPPVWLFAVVLLTALVGLARRNAAPARLGWLVATLGVVGGVLVARAHVTLPAGAGEVAGWPGSATALAGAGLLISAGVGLSRLRVPLRAVDFGWRQPAAALLAVAAAATPVVAAAVWIGSGTGSVLRSGHFATLPAFVGDTVTTHDQPRTVAFLPGRGTGGAVTYTLLRDRAPRLGDADLPPDPAQVGVLDTAVSDLAGGFGQRAALELAHAGVRFVLVPTSGAGDLGTTLAAAGGMIRHPDAIGWQVWEVQANAGRLALAVPGQDDWQVVGDGTGEIGRHAPPVSVAYGPPQRLLVLAEAPDSAWSAISRTSPGAAQVPLPAATYDGMQAFVVPAAGGEVTVFRKADARAGWLLFELAGIVLVVLAAAPTRRRVSAPADPDDGGVASALGAAASRIGANA